MINMSSFRLFSRWPPTSSAGVAHLCTVEESRCSSPTVSATAASDPYPCKDEGFFWNKSGYKKRTRNLSLSLFVCVNDTMACK